MSRIGRRVTLFISKNNHLIIYRKILYHFTIREAVQLYLKKKNKNIKLLNYIVDKWNIEKNFF